jgi:hypothetical protein
MAWARALFAVSVCAVFAYAAYRSRGQFIAWRGDPYLGMYLVPPYRSLGYFFDYAFTRFWLPYIIALGVGLCVAYGARRLNARRGGMIFEPEEPYLMAAGFVLAGHPGWIFYAAITALSYCVASVIAAVAYGVRTRVSFYYFWLLCALATLLVVAYLGQYAWYRSFLV